MGIENISSMNLLSMMDKVSGSETDGAGKPSFMEMLQNQIQTVDGLLNTSDKKAAEVAVGKSENLHEAMIAYEKADSALKLLVQVRNKALDAYNEVLRMQV